VIPLARKLKECQVFGASGHEFQDCAIENRIEWEQKGREIVEDMKREMDALFNESKDLPSTGWNASDGGGKWKNLMD
jgi:hypothetical protein